MSVETIGQPKLYKMFEDKVDQQPDAIAICCNGVKITYRQLNDQANQIAMYLLSQSLVPDYAVGILAEESIMKAAAILGVLKSGHSYMLIDPSIHEADLENLIFDENIEHMLTSHKYVNTLNRLQWACPTLSAYLCIDTDLIHDEEASYQDLEVNAVWEYLAEQASDENAGWTNSYTGETLSKQEINEFADNIYQKIKPYLNDQAKVLEIGCATGLTMFHVAESVGLYHGTDVSAAMIEKNRKKLAETSIGNVNLSHIPAHRIDSLDDKNYDLVILNSVVQYFPSHNYLRQVLAKAIEIMNGTGIIFIGDILNQDLKQDMLSSLNEYKQINVQHRTKTDWSNELFLSERYWSDLAADFNCIQSIQVSKKIHTIENELTTYRYDTILEINKHVSNGRTEKHKSKRQHVKSFLLEERDFYPSPFPYRQQGWVLRKDVSGKPVKISISAEETMHDVKSMKEQVPFLSRDELQVQVREFDHIYSLFPLLLGKTIYVADNDLCHNESSFKPDIVLNVYMDHCNSHLFTHLHDDMDAMLRVTLIKQRAEPASLLLETYYLLSGKRSKHHLAEAYTRLLQGMDRPSIQISYQVPLNQYDLLLDPEVVEKGTRHFVDEWSGEIPLLELLADYARPPIHTFARGRQSFILDSSLSQQVKEVARSLGAEPKTLVMSFFHLLLSKYADQEEVIVGTIQNLNEPNISRIAGPFDHTIAIRSHPVGDITFYDFMREVEAASHRVLEFDRYPVNEWLGNSNQNLSRHPLFSAVFMYTDIENENFAPVFSVRMSDLLLEVRETKDNFLCSVDYYKQIFDPATIDRLAGHYIQIARDAMNNPFMPLAQISLLTSSEHKQIMAEFNDTSSPYNLAKTIVELFEEQAAKTPNAIAVLFENEQCTYRQLNEKANRIAHYLAMKDVQREQIVGIAANRSMEMIIGIWGVWKAGGVFLPIDPQYPNDRIRFMLDDSQVSLLLTHKSLEKQFTFTGELLCFEDIEVSGENVANPSMRAQPYDAAYVIYTSGTTGKPKGVVIEHRSISNTLQWRKEVYEMKSGDKILPLNPFVFDAFIAGMATPLLSGATLCMLSDIYSTDPGAVAQQVLVHQIAYLVTTPSMYSAILECLPPGYTHQLRVVTVGGEKINQSMVRKSQEKFPIAQIMNEYGPTENSIITSALRITDAEQKLTIGKPIANTDILIFDRHGQLLPIGVPGELCVAGAGIARGYLHDPEGKEEKFVRNPIKPEERMYRTGDMARWLPDGSVEYLGRIDDQVKVRGFRIEPGEIESCLLEQNGVKEAVVIVRKNALEEPFLCAYVVLEKDVEISGIKSYLSMKLPVYMIPSHIVILNQMPLTSNGKIDKRALPDPEIMFEASPEEDKPSSEVEVRLMLIWQELLSVNLMSPKMNFFDLGGHSLKASLLLYKIQKEFSVDINIKDIFECPTVSEQADLIKRAVQKRFISLGPIEERELYPESSGSDTYVMPIIPRAASANFFPVSNEQKRMFALSMRDPEGIQYNTPAALRLYGNLNLDKFKEAVFLFIERHESLRSSFSIVEDEVVQTIHQDIYTEWEFEELGDSDLDRAIEEFIRPFHLQEGPLMRVKLLRLNEANWVFLIDVHHIVFDALSFGIFLKEIGDLYEGRPVNNLPLQYKDYALWQKNQAATGAYEQDEKFWMELYAEGVPVLNLPTDYLRPSMIDFKGSQIRIQFDSKRRSELEQAAKACGCTLYMYLMAGFQVLLSKYSGQDHVVLGAVASGRIHPDIQQLIGMFVNTIAVYGKPEGAKTVNHFLSDIKREIVSILEHQALPFDEVMNKLDIRRDNGRNPFFDVLFSMEDWRDISCQIGDIQVEPYAINAKSVKFDLALLIEDHGDQLVCRWEYRESLFEADTINRMGNHYLRILETMVQQPDVFIRNIDMLHKEEKDLILHTFNRSDRTMISDGTVIDAFEWQVRQNPEKTAVVFGAERISYAELNDRSNQLASFFIHSGVKREEIIAIMVNHSVEMIVAMLGVLKSGASYLPIDPHYPKERIQHILTDSRAKVMLTEPEAMGSIQFSGSVLHIHELLQTGEHVPPVQRKAAESEDLAYVIYTSGSSGKPKGVMIEHKSLMNLCIWHKNQYELTPFDQTTKLASFGFDASVWEVFPTLISGACLHIIDEFTRKDMNLLNQYFNNQGITVSFLPTQLCEQFIQLNNESLRLLLTGGDKLKSYQLQKYAIANNYGPTENTVVTTSCFLHASSEHLPIGSPILNTKVYILNSNDQLQPVGLEGELCIAGVGLARGYLHNETMTNEKFIDGLVHPGERIYRTGDLVKWLPDGNIRFIGRKDRQVKIRGNRVEIGEIEYHLLQHESIKEAVVAAIEDSGGSVYLCAYVVFFNGLGSIDEVRIYLANCLPDYMVPSQMIEMDALPLTENGKVNMVALSTSRSNERSSISRVIVKPRNEVEETLLDVWRGTLFLNDICIHDRFYHIGGDSIKAIQLSSRLQHMGLRASVKDILEHPTIAELGKVIKKINIRPEQMDASGQVRLTPIQRWLFEFPDEIRNYFNQSTLLHSKKGFNPDLVTRIFSELCRHHENLRTVFSRADDQDAYTANILSADAQTFDFHIFTIDDPTLLTNFIQLKGGVLQSSMNPMDGPLIQLGLFQSSYGDYLLIVIHHLIIDGVSWRILLQDFVAGYEQLLANNSAHLSFEKTASFQRWAEKLEAYSNSKEVRNEFEYWNKIENGSFMALPKNDESSVQATRQCYRKMNISYSKEVTSSLLRETNRAYNTEINEILLSALATSIREWASIEDIRIDLESHGRESVVDADVSRTIGWFTSVYPILLSIPAINDIGQSIKLVKESVRSIPHKGIGFGLLSQSGNPDLHIGRNRINKPEICFNYLGQFDGLGSELFDISDLQRGEEIHPDFPMGYSFVIEGMVIRGRLEIDIYYNSLQYSENTVRDLAELFRNKLMEIIQHCIERETSELTPSDCSSDGIDFDTLEAVFGEIGS
ncbi:amino acid adenylation domain-containing protein [Paenibacillus sp. SI8]|uniref:amino acid adenylation domain-containing protein n=1 Tax=unclassified Paenibacillus TaxID=185978 RepID=UPI0034676492